MFDYLAKYKLLKWIIEEIKGRNYTTIKDARLRWFYESSNCQNLMLFELIQTIEKFRKSPVLFPFNKLHYGIILDC